MKMKKRLLASMIALLLALSMLPTALADGTGTDVNPAEGAKPSGMAAQIGEETYETLTAAVSAASDGGTIKLLDDVSLSAPIEITGRSVAIDGGGYSITYGQA